MMIDDHYDKDIMEMNSERVSARQIKAIAARFNSIRDSLYLKGGADQFKDRKNKISRHWRPGMGDVIRFNEPRRGDQAFIACKCGQQELLPVVLMQDPPVIVAIVCPACESSIDVINGVLQLQDDAGGAA